MLSDEAIDRAASRFMRKLAEVGGVKSPRRYAAIGRLFVEAVRSERNGFVYEERLDQVIASLFGIGREQMKARLRPYFDGLAQACSLIEELTAKDYEDARFDDIKGLIEPLPEKPVSQKRKKRS